MHGELDNYESIQVLGHAQRERCSVSYEDYVETSTPLNGERVGTRLRKYRAGLWDKDQQISREGGNMMGCGDSFRIIILGAAVVAVER